MQALITRTFSVIGEPLNRLQKVTTSGLPAICGFCNNEIYGEADPDAFFVFDYFHVNDNTPICDAKL